MTGHPVNEGLGAAHAKTGMNALALNRGMGLDRTMSGESFKTKVRSPHNSADGPNYLYKDVGDGLGGNVIGYGPGNGGASGTPSGTHGN